MSCSGLSSSTVLISNQERGGGLVYSMSTSHVIVPSAKLFVCSDGLSPLGYPIRDRLSSNVANICSVNKLCYI